jgi:hypothetical protein
MAERKEVSSRDNILISASYLWVTLSLFGHNSRVVAFKFSLNYERNKKWKNDGLGKSALQMKVPHALYKGIHE